MNDSELREALDTIFDILGGITSRLKFIESALKENSEYPQRMTNHRRSARAKKEAITMTGFGFRPEALSEPLLRAELRQVRGDMTKLIGRYEALTAEFDRRHPNSNGTQATTEVPALADEQS